jgi:uncharacterized membrane protein YgcG
MSLFDILLLVLGLAAVAGGWLVRRRGVALRGDRMYAGLTPGLVPVAGGSASVVPAPGGEYAGEIAVAFAPPRDVAPGVGGVVVDNVAEARDVTATVLDLAVRGWLTVRAVEVTEGHRDWELTQRTQAGADVMRPFESRLYEELFRTGPVTTLGEVAGRADRPLVQTREDLERAANEQGWYEHVGAPAYVRLGIVVVAVVVAWLALQTGHLLGLIAAALVIVGALLAYQGFASKVVRSASGTATRIQLLGFKKYLATAEADQFSFEEAGGIFSRYLPWAIVFGVAEHWAKVFADIATAARDENIDFGSDLDWFGTYMAVDLLTDVAFASMFMDLGGLDSVGGIGDGAGFDGNDFFGGGDSGGDSGSDIGGDGGGFDFGGGDGGGFDFGGFD